MSIPTEIGTTKKSSATQTRVVVIPDFTWWPKAGQVLILAATYELDVSAVGPAGWTHVACGRVIHNGREQEASMWWYLLHEDYDGWRTNQEPILGIKQIEIPAIHFSRVNDVELIFQVWEDIEPATITEGSVAGRTVE